jgi:hypothetical protein
MTYLKTTLLARLSILILSKAYPSIGYMVERLQVSFAEKQQRVCPYFHILAFRF